MPPPLALLAALGLLALPACDQDRQEAPPRPLARQDVPAAPLIPDIPGEQPLPSVRTYPTGEIPDDPHLAEGYRVYRKACMVCHDRGAANAPPLTDTAEWRPRLAQGKETLYRHAIEGYKGSRGFMPPKGGSPGAWTNAEVRAAVDYMAYAISRLP